MWSEFPDGQIPASRKFPKILRKIRDPQCGGDYITQNFSRSITKTFYSGRNFFVGGTQEGFDECIRVKFIEIFGAFAHTDVANGDLQSIANS